MAIYHHTTKIISRSKGRSAVGSSAYRSGEKIENERDGITHDYTRKKGIVYTEIQTSSNAPEWASDRGKLWNEVEKIEKAKNSQLAREVEFALPEELTTRQQIELVKEYVKDNFTEKGMVADIAIHDKGDGNPHCHVMLTMRPFNDDGTWSAKCKKEYILNTEGEKVKLKSGEYKSRKVDTVDWNTKEVHELWRENWAKYTNQHLERYGHKDRIDHRSYKEQGIQKQPTIHEGPKVRAMEKRGVETKIHAINKDIETDNKMIGLIDRQIDVYTKQKEREIENESRIGDYGIRDKDNRAAGGIRAGEEQEARGTVDWGSVERTIKNEGNRLSKQSGNAVTTAIQQQVRDIEERTNRAIGKDNQEDSRAADKQRPVERSNKPRSFDLDR